MEGGDSLTRPRRNLSGLLWKKHPEFKKNKDAQRKGKRTETFIKLLMKGRYGREAEGHLQVLDVSFQTPHPSLPRVAAGSLLDVSVPQFP